MIIIIWQTLCLFESTSRIICTGWVVNMLNTKSSIAHHEVQSVSWHYYLNLGLMICWAWLFVNFVPISIILEKGKWVYSKQSSYFSSPTLPPYTPHLPLSSSFVIFFWVGGTLLHKADSVSLLLASLLRAGPISSVTHEKQISPSLPSRSQSIWLCIPQKGNGPIQEKSTASVVAEPTTWAPWANEWGLLGVGILNL